MAIIKGPLALRPDQIDPRALLVLRQFIEYFTPDHGISKVHVDTNIVTGDHVVVITLQSLL